MRTLIWGKSFVRAFKRYGKKHPSLMKDVEKTLKLLVEDPFAPPLETHKLKGKLAGSWACEVGYDLRIVFDFIKKEGKGEDDIFLLEIGSHEEVY
ncbi:MAG: type II toxin-antitoxin system mRNA interferase toxin, RelE/StbE family [Deltaproteobacteria bacterium]|nr:type II toxin-antitoxin system mRNA interferase toxin, RelE/StbE family [Deltaproteobacteria bacterium]MBM4348087.1 type II toxin-antitoxin system mRNA interferase toxin, RelE/StbE family [Deltaproteobacteria bacterium]